MTAWKRDFFAILSVAAAALLLISYYVQVQPPLTHGNYAGWDGVHYINMAEQLADGQPLSENKPLVYRVGTPALVAMVKSLNLVDSTYSGFFAVNITFAFLNAILVYFLISRLSDRRYGVAGALFYVLHWISAPRFVVFAPIVTDPGGLFFLFLGLIALVVLRDRLTWLLASLSVVVAVGVAFREFVFLLPIILIISRMDFDKAKAIFKVGAWRDFLRPLLGLWPPLVAGIGAMMLVRLNVHEDTSSGMTDYGFLKTAMFHFWINSPQYFFYAFLSTFGLALVFPLLQFRHVWKFLKSKPEIFVALVLITVAAYVGGQDTERYINWGLPLFFVVIAKAMEAEKPSLAIIILISVFIVIFVCRLPWIIPDYVGVVPSPRPVFTFLTDDFAFLDLYVLHADTRLSGRAFYQHMFVLGLLGLYLRRAYLLAVLAPMFGRKTRDMSNDD